MKIDRLRVFMSRDKDRPRVVLAMDTDEGITGWGECYNHGPDLALFPLFEYLLHFIRGQDARRITHIHQYLMKQTRFPPGALGLAAISAIDHCLWDISAKALGVPVYQLMGGHVRDKVQVYAGMYTAPDAPQARDAMVQAFHNSSLRVYANDDIVGVEVGGAVKNVLAIATGLCDGMQLGLNARAALITRGLAEITRLGLAMGARADTFMGLSGLGDLVLTATGDLSRNRQVGMALAQGQSLDQVLQSLGHVAEGVYSARTVVQRAQQLGVDMPIAQAVVAVLQGQTSPQQAVATLMGRGAKGE